jgi:excisionase family DNA binding protein
MEQNYKHLDEHSNPIVQQIQELLLKANDRFLTTKQAADYSGFSERQLRKVINNGYCPGYKPGKEILIFKADLDVYIKSHPVKRPIIKRLRRSRHNQIDSFHDTNSNILNCNL